MGICKWCGEWYKTPKHQSPTRDYCSFPHYFFDQKASNMLKEPKNGYIIRDNLVYVSFPESEIQYILDLDDIDLLEKNYYILFRGNMIREGIRESYGWVTYSIHREIMERILGKSLVFHEWVKFIDKNKMNCTRLNLKYIENSKNNSREKSCVNKSVYFIKDCISNYGDISLIFESGNIGFINIEDEDILIDTCVYERTKGHSSYINKLDYNTGTKQLVHRTIMERVLGRKLLQTELVDHINHNGLDNRRNNLRVATLQQNAQNSRKSNKRHYSSIYKGVIWNKEKLCWKASIYIDGNQIVLGLFDNEIDAAHAYDIAAQKYRGEFACINFPKNGEVSAVM